MGRRSAPEFCWLTVKRRARTDHIIAGAGSRSKTNRTIMKHLMTKASEGKDGEKIPSLVWHCSPGERGYEENFMRRRRSWNRGSERRGSNMGSTLRYNRSSSLC